MDSILEVKHISKTYKSTDRVIHAVRDVSFKICKGECLGIVGESGSGKSTIAKLVTFLEPVSKGEIFIEGKPIKPIRGKGLKTLYREIQMVFQSPTDSFDPRMTLRESIMEGLINQRIPRKKARILAEDYMEICGLSKTLADRYPHQVSGGECQRASIARAVALNPKLLICDEATSALDVTIQAQVIELIKRLRTEMSMSYIVISHDIALIQELCDRVLVMYQGELIEEGTPNALIMNPQNAYTKSLVDAVFQIV